MLKLKKEILFLDVLVLQQAVHSHMDIRWLHLHETKGRTTTHCLFRIRRLLSTLKTAQHDCLCFCLIIVVSYYFLISFFFICPGLEVGTTGHKNQNLPILD